VVRPAAGLISLTRATRPPGERLAIACFGIRGVGSAYYLAHAFGAAAFEHQDRLWAVLGFTILVSIILHGATVTPAMRWLDGRRRLRGRR